MLYSELTSVATLIREHREAVLARWRQQVRLLPSARYLDTPALNDHVPQLLDEMAVALESATERTIADAVLEGSPPVHGVQRSHDGYDIVEVVAEYNILRGCLHDLTETHEVPLRGKAFHILNRVFDEAIGVAVQTFATQQALEVQRRREEYLAFVAHDLRTPLNAIALIAHMLESHASLEGAGPDVTRLLRTLRRNVRSIEGMVTTVLKESDHVRTELGVRLERREFDLWPLVEALIHDLHPVAGTASTQLINEIPAELTVFADATLVTRVFQNLIANAIKYTPRGAVVIGARELSSGAECWVRDNGSGVPEDRLQGIFTKLEADPEDEAATGLGLAIVKAFVEAHSGEVSVASREGAGSTFRFTLPRR